MFGQGFDHHRIESWVDPNLHLQLLQQDMERRRQRQTLADDVGRFFVWLICLPVRLLTWPFRRGRPQSRD